MTAISPHDGPVAVTGCSGFTGGHMVRELAIHGYQVRACIRDASSWRGRDAVQYLERLPNVTIHNGCDLFTPGTYDAAFKGCAGVFKLRQCSATRRTASRSRSAAATCRRTSTMAAWWALATSSMPSMPAAA